MVKRLLPLLALLPLAAQARPVLDRPNVVVVFIDDAGYGDFSHTGNPVIHTPNLSRMVADGLNFPQFYASAPACSASRYSILTGRHPARSGLGCWVIGPESPRYMHSREVTLADGLRRRGYATAIFGKWHLGTPNPTNGFDPATLPLAHGFDQWIGTNVSADYDHGLDLIRSRPDGSAPVKGYEILARDFVNDAKVQESLTGRYGDAAVDFIRTNKDRPFFLYVTPNQPHLGVFASDAFKGRSPHGVLGDAIEEIDYQLGRIRETLRETGVEKNTLIVFASDNGPWILFDKTKSHPKYGEARFRVGSALPFRDGKGSDWEGGVRVPGVFCWPGVIAPGSVERTPASTLDIFPTVFALAGEPTPADRPIDGRDIRPFLDAKTFTGSVTPFEYFYSDSQNRPVGVRSGPWKLMERVFTQSGETYGRKATPEKPLLFNVEMDFSERIDLASEHPEIVEKLRAELDAFRKRTVAEGTFWGAPQPRPERAPSPAVD